MILTGHILDGKLRIYNHGQLFKFIKANEDREIYMKLEAGRKNRSTPQNAYYWAVVVKMVCEAFRELGHQVSESDTHEFLKARFHSRQIEVSDGLYIDIPESTADISGVEFMEYIERIKQFASQILGIYIPDPNEGLFFNQ